MKAVLKKLKIKNILNNLIVHRKKSHNLNSQEETTEKKDLFHIEGEIINFELVKRQLGGKEKLVDEVLSMLTDSFPKELGALRIAHKAEDWQAIKTIAHRLNGSSCYTGTVRLKEASSRLENAIRAKNKKLYQALYQQMLDEIAAVDNAIRHKLRFTA